MCHRFDTEMLTIDTSVPEFEFRFHFTGWSVKQSLLLAWTIPTWHWWLGDSLEGFHSSQQYRFHDSFFFKGTTTVAAYTHNTITILFWGGTWKQQTWTCILCPSWVEWDKTVRVHYFVWGCCSWVAGAMMLCQCRVFTCLWCVVTSLHCCWLLWRRHKNTDTSPSLCRGSPTTYSMESSFNMFDAYITHCILHFWAW